MASLPNSRRVTYEEWLQMPEVEDVKEEVVDGEIRIMPLNKWYHTLIVDNIQFLLATQLDRREARVFAGDFGLIIRIAPLTARDPDLAVFNMSTVVEREGYIHSAPQLIVEVLSPSNTPKDMGRKLADYASLGVPELWIVSHKARTVEVRLLEGGELRRSVVLSEGMLKPTCFPHVQIDIARIWAD